MIKVMCVKPCKDVEHVKLLEDLFTEFYDLGLFISKL